MMPLTKIKLTSAKSNKSNIHDSKIVPADPEKSKFNRDVLKMKTEIKEQIKKKFHLKHTATKFYQNLLVVGTLL